MDNLQGLLRLPQVLKLYPVKKSTWYSGIRAGKYPAPVKLGERASAWRTEDIQALIESRNKIQDCDELV